jgi:hypothetical protein
MRLVAVISAMDICLSKAVISAVLKPLVMWTLMSSNDFLRNNPRALALWNNVLPGAES